MASYRLCSTSRRNAAADQKAMSQTAFKTNIYLVKGCNSNLTDLIGLMV